MVVRTRTHSLVGLANPYLICDACKESVKYWHNPERCGNCTAETYNHPCGHQAAIVSKCPSWSPVDGCSCKDKNNHKE